MNGSKVNSPAKHVNSFFLFSEERRMSKVDRDWNHFLPKVNPQNGGEAAPTVLPMPDRAGEESQLRHGNFVYIMDRYNMVSLSRPCDSGSPSTKPLYP